MPSMIVRLAWVSLAYFCEVPFSFLPFGKTGTLPSQLFTGFTQAEAVGLNLDHFAHQFVTFGLIWDFYKISELNKLNIS